VETVPSETSNITIGNVQIATSEYAPFAVVGGGTVALRLKGENNFLEHKVSCSKLIYIQT
jgi:hypothetical protein